MGHLREPRTGPAGSRRPRTAAGAVLAAALLLGVACTGRNPGNPGSGAGGDSWTMWGHDYANTHHQSTERAIGASNAGRLRQKWVAELKGDISATPTVVDGTVYVPDWGGYLSAVDAGTGAVRWQRKVSDYVGFDSYFSRTSPTIDGDWLVIGFNVHHTHAGLLNGDDAPPADHDHDHGGAGGDDLFHGAWVAEVSRADGHLRWVTQVERRTYAAITGNPVVQAGRIVVGVSSNEWDFTGDAGFRCCDSRGSVVSLDAATGRMRWQTYTIPDTHLCDTPATARAAVKGCSFTGGSVWSTPAIDTVRNTAYVGTGQNYTVPDSVRACIVAARASQRPDTDCADPANHFDSLLALDLTTGAIKWATQVLPYDPWNAACVISPGFGNCPTPLGPDADLGSSPNLFTATVDGRSRDIVGSGQKAGVYWALDRDTGRELWHTNVGPGSALGGIEWGTAFDGQRIYAPIANVYGLPYRAPNGTALRGGSWAALNPATGAIEWQTQVPGLGSTNALGSPAVANGVMFGSSIASTGNNFFALDTRTGRVLWRFASGGSSISSPAIVNGVVYWGTGYSHLSSLPAASSNRLYAFSVDGR